jgi:hypothetical protein
LFGSAWRAPVQCAGQPPVKRSKILVETVARLHLDKLGVKLSEDRPTTLACLWKGAYIQDDGLASGVVAGLTHYALAPFFGDLFVE